MTIPIAFSQVTHLFTGTAAPTGAAITFGVGNIGGDTPVEIAEACSDIMESDWLPLFVNTLVLEKTLVKNGPDETGPSGEFASGQPGGSSSEGVPPNVSVLVSKRTALGGRQGRGRLYMPGYREANVLVGGTIETASLTALQASADTWLAALSTAGYPMFLLHGDALAPTEVTELVVQSRVATQRRRLRR